MAKKEKNLLIVESPAKAITIKKYLGSSFQVMASVGHIKDLPKSKLGVEVDKGFEPVYVVMPGKKKVISDIKKAAKAADNIYLAPDPDREGEAIAWHIAEEIGSKKKNVHRVLFNAITKDSVKKAIKEPLKIDMDKVNSQQARRILDRLVGYKISPILWEKLMRGLSAGRVQSVALRLIVEREAEIAAFKPEEYWDILAKLTKDKSVFDAKLFKYKGKNPNLPDKATTEKVLESIKGKDFKVSDIEKKERKRNPYPPFITSKLQQEASRKLGFSASKTMMLAQRLYEGIELGEEGSQGLITYMRTDSVRIIPEAQEEARKYISKEYGKNYLPEKAPVYKTKKSAQDAHEAIRPTSLQYTPAMVKPFVENDMLKLYQLIWNRYISSQMSPAVYDQTKIDISAGKDAIFRLNGSIVKFPGFTAVYTESKDEEVKRKKLEEDSTEEDDDSENILPEFKMNEVLRVASFENLQHFTQPPARFTDATLIKELEEKGIGRPSTYASILSNITGKKYVDKIDRKYHPTKLGSIVTELLVGSFPKILNVEFTAEMEEELDQIEEGKLNWKKALTNFYKPFAETVEEAKENMKNFKAMEIPTNFVCEKCSNPMIVKWGRNGEFMACKNYPECKNTKEIKYNDKGEIEIVVEEAPDVKCPNCGSQMLLKNGRFGKFLACSKYPECKTTQALRQLLGIKCPKCGEGDIVKKTAAKTRKAFYACNKYPNCDYLVNDKPILRECPECKGKILLEKTTKTKGKSIYCPTEGCNFREDVIEEEKTEE